MRGNILKAKLTMKGSTFTELAKVLGMSYTAFSNKIHGKSEFSRAEIQKIREYLNLSMEDIESIFFADELE